MARWLASKGVTSFVLKYRLVETKTDNPVGEMLVNFQDFDKAVGPVVELASADGAAAMGYVRRHATEFALKSDRIGIMGFSPEVQIAASVACTYTKKTRPDFVAAIYANWPENSGEFN